MNDNHAGLDRQTLEEARLLARREEYVDEVTDLATKAVAKPKELTLAEIQDIGWALLKFGKSLRHCISGADRAMMGRLT